MPSSPGPAIRVEHLSKYYRLGTQQDSLRDTLPHLLRRWVGRNGQAAEAHGFWALKDVGLEVRPGETLGIVGPNGAGKSTILKILSRITRQTTGTVTVRGRLAALIELGGGFHPDLTGRENLYLQGTMLGLRRRDVQRMFDSIVAFSELEQFLDTPVKRYSSGMVVRLGFAIAAHVAPEVLLLDEVLAVGDLMFQQKCLRRVRELKQQGTAQIFISHNLNAVESICDRALLLDRGQVMLEGAVKDVCEAYRDLIVSQDRQRRATGFPQVAGAAPTRRPHALEIAEVDLVDHEGIPCQQVTTGDTASIRIRYRAGERVGRPVIQVSVERLDGMLCHATAAQAPGALEGDGEIALTYAELNLLPNTYWISATISEVGSHIPLAAAYRAGSFEVTSDLPDRGAIHLEHQWSFNGMGKSTCRG